MRVSADGRKSVGGIPYDVFFDDPLAIAADSQSVASTAKATAPQSTPTPQPAATETAPMPANSSAEADWGAVITMENVQDEVKKVRNHLKASLQAVGTYNGNYKDLQVDGATLAALAAIVNRHPDSVSWKENAKYVRDLGREITKSSTALGAEPYEKTRTAYEKLEAVLNGTLPPDLGNAEPTRPFQEVADRNGLMRRMKNSYEWLSSNVNSESVFKKEQETVAHESQLLTALATVVAHPGYGSAEEAEYRTYAKKMIDASLAAAEATKAGDYSKFSESLAVVNKACNECHADYRFAE